MAQPDGNGRSAFTGGLSSRAAIASELAWIVGLRREGVATTPVPVAGLDGELIQVVAVTAS